MGEGASLLLGTPRALLSEVTWAHATTQVIAQKGPHLPEGSAVTVLKFLIFEKGVLRAHCALDPARCVASLSPGTTLTWSPGSPCPGSPALDPVAWSRASKVALTSQRPSDATDLGSCASCTAVGCGTLDSLSLSFFVGQMEGHNEVVIKMPSQC